MILIDIVAGATTIDVNTEDDATVIVDTLLVIFPDLAVILVVPAAIPVTLPVASTTAFVVSVLVHDKFAQVIVLLF